MELIFKVITLTASISFLLTVCFFPLFAQTPTSPPSPSPSPRTQSIVYVSGTTGSDETGDGSQANPWATIQHALNSTVGSYTKPAEVRVAWGTYTENIVMGDYERIYGGYDPSDWSRDIRANETIIAGSGGGANLRTITGASSSTIDGFTITGGGYPDYGGGVYCPNVDTEISNCVFAGNGAGINSIPAICPNTPAEPTIRDCTFRENDCGIASFVIYAPDALMVISGCTFTNNRCALGAGYGSESFDISNSSFKNNLHCSITPDGLGKVDVTDCEIIGNGGGISGCHGTFTRCVVKNNGGGIHFGPRGEGGDSSLTVDSCIIVGNAGGVGVRSDLEGWATLDVTNSVIAYNGERGVSFSRCIYADWGSLSVRNSTIVGHTNYGIRGVSDSNFGSGAYNCIVWNNGDDLYNTSARYSNISDGDPGEGNISVDPLFIDPANDNYRLSFDSPCIDAGTVVSLTEDCAGNPRPVDGDFSGVAEYDMGAYEYMPSCLIQGGDYNGDGTADIAIFRPSTGLWAVRGLERVYFGTVGDIPAGGDYEGDGTTDIAIYRPSLGLWAVKGLTRSYYGGSGSIPVPHDYDGDGSCDVGIFRPSSGLWAVRGVTRAYLGSSGDMPVPGDYDGDSEIDIAVFRGSYGLWAGRGVPRVYFGSASDEPVPGDYDGDGTWEAGIFRPNNGTWAIRGVTRFYYGGSGDRPVPADFNGDSLDDIGTFLPSTGLWEIRNISRAFFGAAGDIPVTR